MIDPARLIYLHGLESTSQSGKARLFALKYPGMLTPDFTGSFEHRMSQLLPILEGQTGWRIIGSSFGGLMGTIFTRDHPDQVRKLVLLAPALVLPPINSNQSVTPVNVPTIIIHGRQDDVVPLEPVRQIARRLFSNLSLQVVDDDHRLHKSMKELDWDSILE